MSVQTYYRTRAEANRLRAQRQDHARRVGRLVRTRTNARILEQLADTPGLSIAELATVLGMSVSAVRLRCVELVGAHLLRVSKARRPWRYSPHTTKDTT